MQAIKGVGGSQLVKTFLNSHCLCFQSMLVCPMEMVKTQMQMERTRGIFETFQRIQQQAGMKGLYRGLGMTMLRDGPALGIYFACFETIMR